MMMICPRRDSAIEAPRIHTAVPACRFAESLYEQWGCVIGDVQPRPASGNSCSVLATRERGNVDERPRQTAPHLQLTRLSMIERRTRARSCVEGQALQWHGTSSAFLHRRQSAAYAHHRRQFDVILAGQPSAFTSCSRARDDGADNVHRGGIDRWLRCARGTLHGSADACVPNACVGGAGRRRRW